MGRSHASEAPSSFIMQGLIDFLVSSHEVAQELRKHLIFKLVPMMNPDGVFLGNTMGNLLGQDLNRHWHEPDRFLHPGLHAVRQLIHSYDREHDLDMILDVHSHISLLGLFVVGNSYDDVYRWVVHYCCCCWIRFHMHIHYTGSNATSSSQKSCPRFAQTLVWTIQSTMTTRPKPEVPEGISARRSHRRSTPLPWRLRSTDTLTPRAIPCCL